MPLTLPDLDDRRFADLMAEARALIPALAPDWTNHNPTDPGITLIELFAWATEAVIYRLDRVTTDHTIAFLKLLRGPDWTPAAGADLARDVRETVLELRRCDRAVTAADFRALALAADPRVARAACIPRRDLAGDPAADAPAHLGLVILPTGGGAPPPDLLEAVGARLEPRRLLTTKLRVAAPRWVEVTVAATLFLQGDAVAATVRAAAVAALLGFLDPLTGGEAGEGWPFGRAVYVSEIYRLLGRVPGVDYVARSVGRDECATTNGAVLRDEEGGLIGIGLAPDQLVAARIDPLALTVIDSKRGWGA
jgi:hypothetical protein